ncbi:MAG TPA: N-acetyltransferase, partial [Ktedonobacteraceae bacterium]|nr:N-acetyltransferase [Ktedonobacteraceae bacterium]
MEHRHIRQAREADHQAVVDCVRAAYARYLERMGREPAPLSADYAALITQGVVSVLEQGTEICGIL